jgi:RimJ/RimL family protein N-acetyltransferase
MHRLTRPRPSRTPRDHVVVPLRDGGVAAIRPLRAGEKAPLLAVFDQMSPTSRASRYLVGLPALTRSMISTLAAVDGRDHVAWLASVDGRPVGVARYIRVEPTTAEIALEVADAHQGRGLGTALLDAVTTLACVNGIRRVEAVVLPDNLPSQRLLSRIGVPLQARGSTLEGNGPLRLLDPPSVDRAAVVALAARGLDAQAGSERAWTTAAGSGH